jgi:hypothetical protein
MRGKIAWALSALELDFKAYANCFRRLDFLDGSRRTLGLSQLPQTFHRLTKGMGHLAG